MVPVSAGLLVSHLTQSPGCARLSRRDNEKKPSTSRANLMEQWHVVSMQAENPLYSAESEEMLERDPVESSARIYRGVQTQRLPHSGSSCRFRLEKPGVLHPNGRDK
jgi:hypothetical protein